MKRIGTILIVIFCISVFSGCNNKDREQQNVSINKNDIETKQRDKEQGTLIYLSVMNNRKKDLTYDSENCSGEVVKIVLDEKLSPKETLGRLFTYVDNGKDDDKFNVFSTSKNLKIEDLIIKNDFATLKLSDSVVFDNLVCDGQRIRTQIEKTLLQFSDIGGVDIFIGDKELGSYLNDIKGGK